MRIRALALALLVGAAAALAPLGAFAQAPAPATPRPNDGTFILPIMCDTEANYQRLMALAAQPTPDANAAREFDALMQQGCVLPGFATSFVVTEEKGELVRIELRRVQDGQLQVGASYWTGKRHIDRFRCQEVTLNHRPTC